MFVACQLLIHKRRPHTACSAAVDNEHYRQLTSEAIQACDSQGISVDSDILTHLTQFAWAMSYNDALCHVIHIYRPIIMQLNHSLTETQIIALNLVGSTALCDAYCLLFCWGLGVLQQWICNFLSLMKHRPYMRHHEHTEYQAFWTRWFILCTTCVTL